MRLPYIYEDVKVHFPYFPLCACSVFPVFRGGDLPGGSPGAGGAWLSALDPQS